MPRLLIAGLLLLPIAGCTGAGFGSGLSPNCRIVIVDSFDGDDSSRNLRCGGPAIEPNAAVRDDVG